eukprot:TRINITY_DN3915_c0_g1_i4.p1 TRINITY_DN3915_c0_g1~~TRINITY_DN3915_c0_g1_i4.p1  ORF type:complete len:245 (-),score=43.82 TRINITY_DN3915_c0_g1_i4:294-1028(-)
MLNKFKDVSTYATTLSDVKQVVVFNVAAKPKSWPGKVACFVMQFCFSFQIGTLETVAIPLVDNRFAFTTVYNCLTFLCIGVITITVILIQRVMRFKERTALLVGIFLMIAALITAFQYPVHGFAPTFGLFCVTIALMATGFALTVATVPVIYASLIERSAHRELLIVSLSLLVPLTRLLGAMWGSYIPPTGAAGGNLLIIGMLFLMLVGLIAFCLTFRQLGISDKTAMASESLLGSADLEESLL